MPTLDNRITGSAAYYVVHVWPTKLTQDSWDENVASAIRMANDIVRYIVANKIAKRKALDPWLYGNYVNDNMWDFIQWLILDDCWPVKE